MLTGRLTDFLGPGSVAYLLTTIEVGEAETAALQFSTIDAMAIWANGRFEGYSEGERYAWYDFGVNPDHPPKPYSELALEQGVNRVLIRVRGGTYATGGFYAAVERQARAGSSEQATPRIFVSVCGAPRP